MDLLQSKLRNDLFGQHIVHDKLIAVLKSHFSNKPQKPLVISMHGWTGGGKNYVSKIKYVHMFSGRLHFPLSSQAAVEEYTVNLQNWIRGNVSECPRSIFIFDEVDKLPAELVEAMKPFFDYHSSIDSIDFRQSIFIFLSNMGGNVITKTYMDLWNDGVPRERMEYVTFERVLRKLLYNTAGYFEKSAVLEDHLITLFLPFLPLERRHVAMCVEKEMERLRLRPNEQDVENILDQMEFFQDKFSVSGCKRVNDLVAMLAYRSEF
ncbi:UNVERIFIED_CONTAM: hypothetical protein PYX00_003333 [Menopon gallinae]|uniref:Torsin-1A C-terminal domain-containing protein n=1 Tax=Menopon gallinae TaxID=328185 RepID=A0AAW2HZY3_9NEOP